MGSSTSPLVFGVVNDLRCERAGYDSAGANVDLDGLGFSVWLRERFSDGPERKDREDRFVKDPRSGRNFFMASPDHARGRRGRPFFKMDRVKLVRPLSLELEDSSAGPPGAGVRSAP